MDFHITPDNAEQLTGAGYDSFVFGGHMRMLNANKFAGTALTMYSSPMAEADLIPEEQWPDLIADKDRAKSWLYDIVLDQKIPCKDQDGLGFCHGYGPVTCLEVMRCFAGFPYKNLSAESVAGRVTGWSNRGGDPEEDLEVLAKYGACEAAFMDRPNSISPARWKAGWEQNALLYRATEFLSGIRSKMWEVAGTAALRSQATSPWFNWWSHCISGSYKLKYDAATKTIWRMDRNNWGADWGDDGFCWFRKGTSKGLGTPSGILVLQVAQAA